MSTKPCICAYNYFARVLNHFRDMLMEQNCFARIQNYFIQKPNVLCAQYTNIVLYAYTMVKHTNVVYELYNFVNIKGFVCVKVALCMYTKYMYH